MEWKKYKMSPKIIEAKEEDDCFIVKNKDKTKTMKKKDFLIKYEEVDFSELTCAKCNEKIENNLKPRRIYGKYKDLYVDFSCNCYKCIFCGELLLTEELMTEFNDKFNKSVIKQELEKELK